MNTMKVLCLITLSFAFALALYGQKTEFSISLNSGLFSFTGQSTEKVSQMNHSSPPPRSYTNNPYGSKNGLCYGLSTNLKRITRINFVFGFDLGYEVLRSKININSVVGNADGAFLNENASGRTFLNYHFINLNPHVGWRINLKKISIDLLGGMDFNYCSKAREKGKATTNDGTIYKSSEDRKTISTDLRPRVQIAVNQNKVGIYVGYSHGLGNYRSGYLGGINDCYARLLRFGVAYQVN